MTDGRNRDLNYYRCENCSLWNYDISRGLDQSQYTGAYLSPTEHTATANVRIRSSWEYLRERMTTPGRILDIGCGNACLLYHAREAGWQTRGLELSEDWARSVYDDTRIEIRVADFLEYAPDEGETYDVVVLRHVLEHLQDPILAMRKVGALLKDDGRALLEFPNTRSIGYFLKRLSKNRGLRNDKFSEAWRPGHCNEFCRESFEYLTRKTGFEIIDWQTYSSKPALDGFYRLIPVASKARAFIRKAG
jgi:SAM-dependent methyltransferase